MAKKNSYTKKWITEKMEILKNYYLKKIDNQKK